MRLRPFGAVLLVVALSACSAPAQTAQTAPKADVSPPASAASSLPAAADLPVPPGVLPAPVQREPIPAPAGSSAAAGPGAPPTTPDPTPSAGDAATPPATTDPAADLRADPGAVDVVVNKRRALVPANFVPADLRQPNVATATDNALLRPETAAAVETMFAAAEGDGVGLVLVSGYRSFENQESTYAYWVGQYGGAAGADTVSARPGYSEHQTGLAFDIGQADGACTLVSCFAQTSAAQWAAENAAEYGIILRYPLRANEVTGFSAEPWHFRFVGTEVALAMKAAGTTTLEEHFGLPAAPSY